MVKMIKKAIYALEKSSCNEIELTDGSIKVRVVKQPPVIWYYYPSPIYQYPYPSQ